MNTAMTVLYTLEDPRRAEPAGGQLHQLRPGAHRPRHRPADAPGRRQRHGLGVLRGLPGRAGQPAGRPHGRAARPRPPSTTASRVNPAFATLGTAAALAGGYQPASAGASSAAAMLQNVGAAAALGDHGPVRPRAAGPPRRRASRRPSRPTSPTTSTSSYSKLLSDEQRGEFGDTLNASTVMPNLLNAMLAKLDASKGDAASRFPANAEGGQGGPGPARAHRGVHGPDGPDLRRRRTRSCPPATPPLRRQARRPRPRRPGKTARRGRSTTRCRRRTAGRVFAARRQGSGRGGVGCRATSGVGHCNWTLERRPAGRQRGVRPQPDRQQPHARRASRAPTGSCGALRA